VPCAFRGLAVGLEAVAHVVKKTRDEGVADVVTSWLELAGEPLHLLVRDSFGFWKDGQRVSAECVICKNVQLLKAVFGHGLAVSISVKEIFRHHQAESLASQVCEVDCGEQVWESEGGLTNADPKRDWSMRRGFRISNLKLEPISDCRTK